MKTVRMTMAQALIRFIDQQYIRIDGIEFKFVEGIFSIFGHGNVCGIGEALEFSDHSLNFIRGNNEQGMAHAATAFAKQHNRRKIYAVTTSIGPGATNLVTAAATATINRLPLLLLPGDVFSSRGPDPVLQQLENYSSHEISVNDSLRAVSRYFDRINRPSQLMSALIKAFAVLTDEALTGAVTIALPQDVQCEAYDYPALFFRKRMHEISRREPSSRKIKEAAELIANSKQPLIILGGGVAYSGAEKILTEFTLEMGIPISETQAGKGVLSADLPTNMGGIGVIGTAAANFLAAKSDCVIAIGTRLADFVTSSKGGFKNESCQIISVNVDNFDVQKLEPKIAICADAKLSVHALYDELKQLHYRSTAEYQRLFQEQKNSWLALRSRVLAPGISDIRLNQVQALGVLNDLVHENAIVVAAAGSLPGDLQRLWQTKSYKGYHLEYGYSCMGYEVCGALGVKMAEPSREVWCMVGDGSFLMLHSEVVTAIQEGLKINIVLFDSGGFNCIKSLQCAMGSLGYGTDLRFRDAHSKKLDGALLPIDFAMLGNALGLKTFRARSLAELADTVKSAQACAESTLIELKIMPNTESLGYDTFWHVPVSEMSLAKDVQNAYAQMTENIRHLRY